MALGMEVGLSPGDFVLDVYCGYGQTVRRIKMKLGMKVGLGPGHIVLDGDPAAFPKGAQSPQFSAHVCCGQTAAWMKMKLGMQVGLGPGHTVLDGDSAQPPIFGPCLLWLNGRPCQLPLNTC